MRGKIISTVDAGLFSLKEAVVLSRLSEDKVRREIERKVIVPAQVEDIGASRRLLFDEPVLLYFSMLRWIGGTVELAPEARTRASILLVASNPDAVQSSAARIRKTPRRPDLENSRTSRRFREAKLDVVAWARLHADADLRRRWVDSFDRLWKENLNRVLIVDWNAIIEDVGPRIDLYRRGWGRIRSDPEILGGEPVFAGTRLALRHIGGLRLKGEPMERIIADYPYLTAEDVEFAALYTEANPPLGRPKASTMAS